MARSWRIEYEDGLYHILSRGNDGATIFYDDYDKGMFLDAAGEMSERFEFSIFAYTLMNNHYPQLRPKPICEIHKNCAIR